MKNYSKLLTFIMFLAFISCTDTGKKGQPVWQDLFNGKDFTGWVQKGGDAVYEIADGIIIGTSVLNTGNSFLCTDKNYGDFILEMEFRVDSVLNSGVQIRSLSYPEYNNGRVHGYQVEIDPSSRAWTGGIYDEARRGWLYALTEPEQEEARKAFKNDEWNKFRIEAIGNHIKTWVNDIPVTNLFDEETPDGFIALQVHAIRDSSKAGTQVMWKNIRIITENPEKYSLPTTAPERSYLNNKLTESEIAAGWKLLFDGETNTGWRRAYQDQFPEKGWRIENGILTVEAANGGESVNGGDIVTMDRYSDFELQLQVRLTTGANSGVKYYVTEQETGNKGSAIGPEFQILDDNNHPDALLGAVPGSRTFGSLYDLIPTGKKRVNGIGQWNTIRIVSKDKHVEHWLNGFKLFEYERGSEEFRNLVAGSKFKNRPGFGEAEDGHILLQDHGNEVSFRNIKIKPL